MEKLPKLKDLNPPKGYFDTFPEEILAKRSRSKSLIATWIPYATAASVLLAFGLWWTAPTHDSPANDLLALDQEVLLYIESNQWTAEDVLSLSEDPNQILDEIIAEEMPSLTPAWSEEENWF